MVKHVVCDFETESAVDLLEVGAWRYAEDPTTNVICLCFEYEGDVVAWEPGSAYHHLALLALVLDPDVTFVRHADFERAIWRCIMVPLFGFPDIPDERWHDTQAVCAMKGVPLRLEAGAIVLGAAEEKDMEGSALVKGWSKYDRKGMFLVPHTPENRRRIVTYCKQDVRVERAMLNIVRGFQPGEREVWLLDQKINERGVKLDLHYINQAQKIVDEAIPPLAAEFAGLTDLRFTQTIALREWCAKQGLELPDLRKDTVARAIGKDVDGEEDELSGTSEITPEVRRALEIRQLIGSASIKKLAKMRAVACSDDRARGLLQYHGAGTGRWAGRLLQPQNFPRPTLRMDDKPTPIDLIIQAILSGDPEWVQMMVGPPVETVVSGLRHSLIAERGKVFVSGDYATIECRMVLALAGQLDKLELFRRADAGERNPDGSKIDVYCDMASKIFGRPISKDRDPEERQFGKNSTLGCGFQMGGRTFQVKYAKDHPLDFCTKVVKSYREEWAPEVPRLWRGLENAALRAVYDGGAHQSYGIEYKIEQQWLTARLPSGRKLYYLHPTKCRKVMPWTDDEGGIVERIAWRYQAIKQGHLVWVDAFGGHLAENAASALARDVLTHSMFLLEAEGFPLVLSVHDEEVAEVDEKRADEKAVKQIMCDSPAWATALKLPINVETWVGDRYRK